MITLSAFQEYSANKQPLLQDDNTHLAGPEQQFLKWATSLSMQSETEQAEQLKTKLIELKTIELEDTLRLQLMTIITGAIDRLAASLHKYYIHESGALSHKQLVCTDHLQSLYYLSILVYDEIVQREKAILEREQLKLLSSIWRRFLVPKTSPLLAGAIYASLASYKKLLYETALSYQKLPQQTWFKINQLYLLSYHYNIADFDVSEQIATYQITSIQQIYTQLCLHSLLNVQALTRASIIQIQRLLLIWAEHVSITREPQTDNRVFIDLYSDNAANYLTAKSSINPYDENHTCLFIELKFLVNYLQHCQQVLDDSSESIEYRLITKILMMINYHYTDRKALVSTKSSSKQRATIITEFNNIHYHVAQQRSLLSVMGTESLPFEQLPRYDTQPKKDTMIKAIQAEVFNSTDNACRFRVLKVLTQQDDEKIEMIPLPQALLSKPKSSRLMDSLQCSEALIKKHSDTAIIDDNYASDSTGTQLHTAPPLLPISDLFLLCRSEALDKPKWSLGIVRWLDVDSKDKEVEWEVLGHTVNACALRLDTIDSHNTSFIPALIIPSDDALHTNPSLLVPSYHFRSQDRVIIRMDDEEKSLCLQRCLHSTKKFCQYEFIIL